jgi:hypothetical protein
MGNADWQRESRMHSIPSPQSEIRNAMGR